MQAEAHGRQAAPSAITGGVFAGVRVGWSHPGPVPGQTAGAKAEAVRSVADSLDRLTAELSALGAVPSGAGAGAGRRPLTWSAHSWSTREELYHDQRTMQMERSGQLIATVALRVTVRDMAVLEDLNGVLAAAPALNVHGVTWHVDGDNPTWPQVRAAAIGGDGTSHPAAYSAAFSRGGQHDTGIPR